MILIGSQNSNSTFIYRISFANSYKKFDILNVYIYQVYQLTNQIKNGIILKLFYDLNAYLLRMQINAIEYLVDVKYSRQI